MDPNKLSLNVFVMFLFFEEGKKNNYYDSKKDLINKKLRNLAVVCQ
jgi:hypothetical protein